MWGRMFQGHRLSGFDSSDIVGFTAPRLRKSKVYWLTKFTLVHPQTQTPAAKFGQESGPTCSVFLLLMMSSAGLDNLAVMSVMCT